MHACGSSARQARARRRRGPDRRDSDWSGYERQRGLGSDPWARLRRASVVRVQRLRGSQHAAALEPRGAGARRTDGRASRAIDSSLGDYLAGQFALESGLLAEAAGYFEQALVQDPDNADLRRQLFLLTLASSRYDAALERAKELAADAPDSDAVAEAALMLALAEVRADRFGSAHRRVTAIGDDGIAGLTLPFVDAWILFGRGDPLDDALARLNQGELLGPLNGYHRAMMLDLGGRLAEATTALEEAMPASGPAPLRMLQAYASMLARQDQRQRVIELIRGQLAERGEQPALIDLLATLEAGGTPARPFGDAAGGIADALLGVAEALHQEQGNRMAVVYARLALFTRPDLAEASLLVGDMMAEQDNFAAAIEAYGGIGPSRRSVIWRTAPRAGAARHGARG